MMLVGVSGGVSGGEEEFNVVGFGCADFCKHDRTAWDASSVLRLRSVHAIITQYGRSCANKLDSDPRFRRYGGGWRRLNRWDHAEMYL